MFFKDFVSVKRQKIKRGASQTYDTPSFYLSSTMPDMVADGIFSLLFLVFIAALFLICNKIFLAIHNSISIGVDIDGRG